MKYNNILSNNLIKYYLEFAIFMLLRCHHNAQCMHQVHCLFNFKFILNALSSTL